MGSTVINQIPYTIGEQLTKLENSYNTEVLLKGGQLSEPPYLAFYWDMAMGRGTIESLILKDSEVISQEFHRTVENRKIYSYRMFTGLTSEPRPRC